MHKTPPPSEALSDEALESVSGGAKGLIEMGEAFKGLPIDQLIGSPLTGAADAQVAMEEASRDFLKNLGGGRSQP